VPDYDVIVAGVGAMGSAAAYHLARRGQRVLGLERFDIPNEQGSSHDVTRIIRLAYCEDPSYVPLLHRAYALWRDLEAEAGEQLLHITGSIDAGVLDSFVFGGSLRSCQEHGLEHEVVDAAELRRRFPAYRLPPDMLAVLQSDGGFLLPERCIVGHVNGALRRGGVFHARERVLRWTAERGEVEVETDRARYRARRLVLAVGAWAAELFRPLRGLAVPERQVLAWLQPRAPALFQPDAFPVFNLEVPGGRFCGFPVHGIPGFKIGRYHHREERVGPDSLRRDTDDVDEGVLRGFAECYFPDGAGPTMTLKVCMFTNTPDEHFVVDVAPDEPEVVIASPCSGHGFKFASVVGEIVADLTLTGSTAHDIGLFRLSRFGVERA
jgi:sarcosine oxidase